MMNITVTRNPHPGTLPPADKLGFGTVFTDHMFVMDYTDAQGWHDARIVPALSVRVVHHKHMVGKHRAEAQLVGGRQRAGMRISCDSDIHHDSLLSFWFSWVRSL